MNRQKWILLVVALLLMGGTGALLIRLRAIQRLGAPGVKTSAIAGSHRLQVELPEQVLDYRSEAMPIDKMVLDYLPQDTSFGQRMYQAPDGFQVQASVVLMGTDRTSLHKPEFCLGGTGWVIDSAASTQTSVAVERPVQYELPVMKLLSTKQLTSQSGQQQVARGIYVYWFVDDQQYTARHWERMWWMAKDMLRTGVLQRWAYISFFAACAPGQEAATFERMKELIAASVPEFQLTPAPPGSVSAR